MSKAVETWQHIHHALAGSQQQFISQLDDIEAIQTKQLLHILERHAQTAFGQKYQFIKIKSISDFRQTVPIHSYEDCQPYLQEMARDSSADIICFEETGGSTQGAKLIPYTQQSFQCFQNALFPWFDDLLNHRPGIKKGTAYWSISPAMREIRTTQGGHSIGLDNDALYFGNLLADEISQTLAVSPQVAKINDLADWRYQTLRDLLLAEDLSFISIWSPTFLLELLHYLPTIADSLLDEIQQQNAKRAAFIRPIISDYTNKSTKLETARLWPKLDTISCWTEGAAAHYIPELQSLFPHSYIQGKGLLATEGIITIPLSDAAAPVLAITSNFYEFIDQHEQLKLAHELEINQVYTIVLTNDSGLYRYNLGDIVRMEGYFHNTPMLTFIGRGEQCSDLCGEKLTDAFVVGTFASFKSLQGFHFLYPETHPHPHYVLLTDRPLSLDIGQIETALCRNPQYRYARKINQLKCLKHVLIKNAMQRYIQWHHQKGHCLGDIKPPSLITNKDLIRFLHEPF